MFDWKKAQEAMSAGVSGTAQGIGQMLLGKYAQGEEQKQWEKRRGMEEEEQIRKEEREETRKREAEIRAIAQSKDLTEFKTKLDAELETNFKDPYRMDLTRRVMSDEGTPEDLQVWGGLQEIEAWQSQNKPLEDRHYQFLKTISTTFPTISAGSYVQELGRDEFRKRIDAQLKSAQYMAPYYGARVEEIKGKPDVEAQKRANEIDDDIGKIKEKMNKITQSEDYQTFRAMEKAGRFKDKSRKKGSQYNVAEEMLKAWNRNLADYEAEIEKLKKKRDELTKGTQGVQAKPGTKETVNLHGEDVEFEVGKVYTNEEGKKFVFIGNGQFLPIKE